MRSQDYKKWRAQNFKSVGSPAYPHPEIRVGPALKISSSALRASFRLIIIRYIDP